MLNMQPSRRRASFPSCLDPRKWLAAVLAAGALLGSCGAASGVQVTPFCTVPIPPTSPPQPPEPSYCTPCTCTGSPCYVASGSFQFSSTDLSIPTAGLPLEVTRSYRSAIFIDGPMGYGWTPSFLSKILLTLYLYAPPSTYTRLAYLLMPDGTRLTFGANSDGTFSPPTGRYDSLVQNTDGTWELTLQRSRTRYRYGTDGTLSAAVDEFGNTLTFNYDGAGRLQRIADTSGTGRYVDVFWGADGRVSAVRDHSGRQVQYSYNGQGALTSVVDPASRTTFYAYTTGRYAPLLTQVSDPWTRAVTTVSYDNGDRARTYTDRGETYTFTYNVIVQVGPPLIVATRKQDSAGQRFDYTFAMNALITDRPTSLGGVAVHTDYYSDGSVQQVTDQVGVKTYYTYNTQGSVTSVTRDYQGSQAVRFDYTYDTNFPEKVASITPRDPATGLVNPDWQAWRYDYYPPGSPAPGALFHVYRVQNDGATLDTLTTYEYNAKGQVTKVTRPLGGATDYGYDSLGNLATVTAPANNDAGTRPVATYGYDAVGRVTSVTDPLGHAAAYTYDGLDRVLTVVLPPPSSGSTLNFTTTYGYDSYDTLTGLVFTSVTDPNGQVTRQGYDQFGRLVRAIDAMGNLTRYAYTRDMLASITDANGNVTSYGYDVAKRLASTTFPDGAVETYTYFYDNLLHLKTDRRNQQQEYRYDSLKRLQVRFAPGGFSATYTYQGQKLTQVSTALPTETVLFAYDSSYRLASDTQGSRGTLNYQYDAEDRVANYMVQGGPTATYSHYPDGSLKTIVWSPVSGQFQYAYTLAGQYQAVTFPNGQARNYSYDDQGRLLQLANLAPGGGNLATYAYGYDLNYTTGAYNRLGQRVSMTATVPSQGLNNHVTTYEYDPMYQLTKATYPNVAPFNGEVASWTYDSIGNRLTNTVNGSTQSYTYQKIGANPTNWQRLLSDGSNSYTYDANGNTATKTGLTFGWNYDDRMTSISGTTTASYAYDYEGRRRQKTVGASTSNYFYSGLNLIQESGAPPSDYLFGPGIDEPLAMSRSGQIYYYSVDSLGSGAIVTNASGAAQDTYLFDAWGQTRSQTGSLANPFNYTGREQGEAGTLFYRARYYSPGIGRFLSEDPARRGPSVYSYVGASPASFTDPAGLTKAQVCCRPLGGFSLSFDSFDHHCFIRVITDNGVPITYSLFPDPGSFPNGTGCPHINDPRDQNATGNLDCATTECVDPRCISEATQKYPCGGAYRARTGPNSNTFASHVAKTCNLATPLFANPTTAPGWGAPPPTGPAK
ncbi:MAG: RHS repeat-associated core domain-containing protein [Thermoanaerobaculia bacterium]